ncbi:MAG: cupin domain-containing protein [Planctomycetota bacterium]|nr:cupin domain-containing protein [Planctomycetota bacterium]
MSKKIEIVSQGRNYTAGNLGRLDADQLGKYEVINPDNGAAFPGKVFLAGSLKATGMEMSFQVMPPGTGLPFSHKHHRNEEIYLVLKGSGEFQVDDACLAVKDGSAVRIAPDGVRTWRNTGMEPMIVLCVQALAETQKKLSEQEVFFC